ncbi:MAG TPA: hypothetical protein VMY37_32015 [Thermoguttaceae bacterium]|nr:hypothetical protein [Thermoguttaceae bacterium]
MIEQMLQASKEKIEFAYANAVEREVELPVVLVLDVRGDGGSWVAERFTERSKIDEVIRESEMRGTVPVLTFAVSQKQAALLLGELNPEARASLEAMRIPDTQFLAIGITDKDIAGRGFEKP